MKSTTFVFVRHAESFKNLKDITGGSGTGITLKGEEQAQDLCQKIKKDFSPTDCVLISSDKKQAVLTGKIIEKELGIPLLITDKLHPADMGVINGMSSNDIKEKYPQFYTQLCDWRNNNIEACELIIEGMEPPSCFWKRMEQYLLSLCNGGVKIIVCTRSILVFAYNYAHGKIPFSGGGYKHVSFKNCETLVFSIDSTGAVVLRNE